MQKPNQLRAILNQAIPYFREDPARLQMYYANGTLHATPAPSNSFQYHYDLIVLVQEFPLDSALVFANVVHFVRQYQHELLQNPNTQNRIEFEEDPNDNETSDLFIKIPLTERVTVSEDEARVEIAYQSEPAFLADETRQTMSLYVRDEAITEWV